MDANDLAIVCGAWLLTYALHSTVLITSAWLAALGLARLACQRWASPRLRDALPELRERLWKVALVGGIATASVQTGLGLDPWGAKFVIARPVIEVAGAPASTASEADTQMEVSASSTPGCLSNPAPMAFPSACEVPPTHSARPFHSAHFGSATPGEAAAPLAERARVEPLDPLALSAARFEPTRRARLTSNSLLDAPIAAVTLDSRDAPATLDSSTSAPAPSSSTPTVIERGGAPTWCLVLLGVWSLGIAYFGARWIWRWNGLLRQLDERLPIVSGSVYEQFQDLRRRSSARRSVTLAVTPGIGAPITLGSLGTFGLAHYTICLPPRVTSDLQPDEIAALLAHELAHTERRDPAWLVLCSMIEVVFFFQPLNRICASWLQDEAEYQCDDWAAVQVGERVSLASCLTEIAGWIVPHERPRLASAMAARGTRLGLRVHRLLDEEHEPSAAPRASWFSFAGAGGALCLGLLVPGFAAEAASRSAITSELTTAERLERLEDRFGALGAESTALANARDSTLVPSSSGPLAPWSLEASDSLVVAQRTDTAAAAQDADPPAAALELDVAARTVLDEIQVLRADLDQMRDEMSSRSIDALFLIRFALLENALQRAEASSRELELLLDEDVASRTPAVLP